MIFYSFVIDDEELVEEIHMNNYNLRTKDLHQLHHHLWGTQVYVLMSFRPKVWIIVNKTTKLPTFSIVMDNWGLTRGYLRNYKDLIRSKTQTSGVTLLS